MAVSCGRPRWLSLVLWLVCGCAAGLVLGAGGLDVLQARPVEPRDPASSPPFNVTLKSRLEVKDHRGQLSPDGKALFVEWWSSTGKIRVLDAQSGKTEYAFDEKARGFELSPDGKLLTTLLTEFRTPDEAPKGEKEGAAAARYCTDMTVWDVSSARKPRKLLVIPDAYRPVFAPNGRSLAVYHQRDDASPRWWELWSLEQGKRLAAFEVKPESTVCPVFSGDGSLLALPGKEALKLIGCATGREVRTLPVRADPLLPGGSSCILFARGNASARIGFAPDGKRLAAGGDDGTVTVWDVDSGQKAATLSGHSQPHTFVRYDPAGRRLLTGSIGQMVVLHVAPGLPGQGPPPRALVKEIDPSKGEAILWDAKTLAQERTLAIRCPISLSWSGDGAILVVGDRSESGPVHLPCLQLWDASRGERLKSFKEFEQGRFSANGRLLLTSSYGQVVLWEVERGPR